MNTDRNMLEDRLGTYEAELRSLNSYIQELNNMTAKHGTENSLFEGDLIRAKHNVKYYEDEIAEIRAELGASGEESSHKTVSDTVLPQTLKQGAGMLLLSSISFLAGVLLGSSLKDRRGGQDEQ